MNKRIAATLLATTITVSLIFAGCGGTGKKSGAAGGNFTLVYEQGSDPRGLDPAYVDDGESSKVICNVYEGLLKYKTGSTELEPCLATSWKISDDGKTYTFNLRKNVKFQDGTPFNADAVVYSIERQLPPLVKDDMPYASFTFDPTIVDKVSKVDDYTVQILLKKRYTPFLANLAMSLSAPIVSPTAAKNTSKSLNENPVGTGPFKFVKWDKGQAITLERNEDYWGSKAKAKKLVFKFASEASVRASDLMTGAADIIDGVDPNDVAKLKSSGLKIYQQKGMNINYFAFNCARAPFNNDKVRQAVSMAINRQEIVKYLYQGYAEVATGPLPSFIPGYSSAVKPYDYNVDKAKELLKEAGAENLKIKMITYSVPRPYNSVGGQKLAESIQSALSKVGITATIQSYPWKEYKAAAAQGEGDIMFYGWTGDNGDADNFLSLFDSNQIESTLNVAKYKNTQVDSLLEQARSTANGKERNDLYKQIQEIVIKDAPWVYISNAQDMAAYNTKVKNLSLHPTGNVFLKDVTK